MSKISFFNGTVLKKDILRFSPLWGIYTAYLVLVALLSFTQSFSTDAGYSVASFSPPVNGYCFLCATFLFGDLFKSKTCNALHAMPLRRETWLFTHMAAGLLFAVIPHTLYTIIVSFTLKEQVFIAWLCWLILLGKTLFHFSLAVFCVMCVGNRLGHLAIFILISFFSSFVEFIYDTVYHPFLYGIIIDSTAFTRFSPAAHWSSNDFFNFRYILAGTANSYQSPIYIYHGIVPQMWIHLGICTALSIPFTLGALHFYRRKNLEEAGDFTSFKPLKWALLLLGSFLTGIILPIIGFPVGFFGFSMLMERSVKVFGGKHWARFGIFAGTIVLTIVLTVFDPLNVVEYIPETNDIESVTLTNYSEDSEQLNFTDSEDIDAIRALHTFALAKRDTLFTGSYHTDITYTLRNGRTVQRSYYTSPFAEELAPFRKTLSSFHVILGTNDVDTLKQTLVSAHTKATTGSTDFFMDIRPEDFDTLFEKMALDVQAGTLVQDDQFHTNFVPSRTLILLFADGRTTELDIYMDCRNTLSYLLHYE